MRVIALLLSVVTFAFVQPLTAQTAASCAPAGNIQFVCGQEGPEDLLHLPGSDWVIASSMAGNGGIRLISVRGKTSTLTALRFPRMGSGCISPRGEANPSYGCRAVKLL
jgi:hypothetical protein